MVLFIYLVIIQIALYVSDRIVTPVMKLTSMCRAILNDGEHASIVLTPDSVSSTATCRELARVTSLFKTLVIVLRFTDPRYFERVSAAVQHRDYRSALVTFQKPDLNNMRGVGICYNNIAGNYCREMAESLLHQLYPTPKDSKGAARATNRVRAKKDMSSLAALRESMNPMAPGGAQSPTGGTSGRHEEESEMSQMSQVYDPGFTGDAGQQMRRVTTGRGGGERESGAGNDASKDSKIEFGSNDSTSHEKAVDHCAQNYFYLAYAAYMKAIKCGNECLQTAMTPPFGEERGDTLFDGDDTVEEEERSSAIDQAKHALSVRYTNMALLCAQWRLGQVTH